MQQSNQKEAKWKNRDRLFSSLWSRFLLRFSLSLPFVLVWIFYFAMDSMRLEKSLRKFEHETRDTTERIAKLAWVTSANIARLKTRLAHPSLWVSWVKGNDSQCFYHDSSLEIGQPSRLVGLAKVFSKCQDTFYTKLSNRSSSHAYSCWSLLTYAQTNQSIFSLINMIELN